MRQSVSSAAAECGDSASRAESTTNQCVVTNQASEASRVALVESTLNRLCSGYLGAFSGALVRLEPRSSGSSPLKVRIGWNGIWNGRSMTLGMR